MTFLSEMRDAAVEVLQDLGTTATLQDVASTYSYDDGGTVATVVTEYTITCSPLLDERDRYGSLQTDRRISGTFYVAALGLSVTPKIHDRVVFHSRTFQILEVFSFGAQDGVAAYRLDVSEIGST